MDMQFKIPVVLMSNASVGQFSKMICDYCSQIGNAGDIAVPKVTAVRKLTINENVLEYRVCQSNCGEMDSCCKLLLAYCTFVTGFAT